MRNLAARSKKRFVIADFICPYEDAWNIFKPNLLIWMDTIKKENFQLSIKLFKKPKSMISK